MSAALARLPAKPVIAVVGATGAVGVEILSCLEKRKFPYSEVRALASARSAGKQLPFAGKSVTVTELTEQSLDGVHLALFSAGSSTSRKFGPIAVSKGAVVVDNSSAFRMDQKIPLVVPEINPETMADHPGIIANPNCAAIISITPLWPIHKVNRWSSRLVRRSKDARTSRRCCRIRMRSTSSATTPRWIRRPATTRKN